MSKRIAKNNFSISDFGSWMNVLAFVNMGENQEGDWGRNQSCGVTGVHGPGGICGTPSGDATCAAGCVTLELGREI